MKESLTITVQDPGDRIDRYLANALPELSRSRVAMLLKTGHVTVNGTVPKASYRVSAGDTISVVVPALESIEAQPEPIPLSIVFEDRDLIVLDKPAGIVVHPSPGHASGTLVNALLAHCPDLTGVGGKLRPGIVHRLDKDTSGLLVVAKNDATYGNLQEQFKMRQVHKSYWALTEGILSPSRGIIDLPIGRDTKNRKRMAVVPRGGRVARTEFEVTEYFERYSLVRARPVTGRTHQIRVHLASLGHPLVGDRVYGLRRQRLLATRHFLHAGRLEFVMPSTGETATFESPLPRQLERVLQRLRES
jgi:23S rRNA pseudouridine1911/1915/1917 synthase